MNKRDLKFQSSLLILLHFKNYQNANSKFLPYEYEFNFIKKIYINIFNIILNLFFYNLK